MTWSIIAHDPRSGQIGIAVATCALAVGARVPFVATGIGAVATQSYVNPFYGLRGLELLRAGASAEDVVRIVTAADEGRGLRQLHVMDRAFRFAAYTGTDCIGWCGHATGRNCSVAGNMLAGPEVIAATLQRFEATRRKPLVERFIAAMRAGQAAGGDKRGQQSAALLIHDGEEHPLYDLRVDDHAAPIEELARLVALADSRSLPYRRLMPSRANPSGATSLAEIEAGVAAMRLAAAKPARRPKR